MERIDAEKYWGKAFCELKNWQKAEVLSTNFFRDKGIEAELMKQCNEGYDILLNTKRGSFRVDVKWSNGKKRNKNEMQFHVKIKEKENKGKGKTTDFFLLCFHESIDDKRRIAGYLIPYNFFGQVDDFTITRQKVREELKKYRLSKETLRKVGILPPLAKRSPNYIRSKVA